MQIAVKQTTCDVAAAAAATVIGIGIA